MKDLNRNLIIIPKGVFREKSFNDFVGFIEVLQKIISSIDHDKNIKKCHEMVILKTKKIKQFNKVEMDEFHQDINDVIESSGTQFLINKN